MQACCAGTSWGCGGGGGAPEQGFGPRTELRPQLLKQMSKGGEQSSGMEPKMNLGLGQMSTLGQPAKQDWAQGARWVHR